MMIGDVIGAIIEIMYRPILLDKKRTYLFKKDIFYYKLLKMKVIINVIVILLVSSLLGSCCAPVHIMSKKGWSPTDYHINNDTVLIMLYHGYELDADRVPAIGNGFLYNLIFHISDSSYYQTEKDPGIVFHSLSFTSKNGDTIPFILYNYKSEGDHWVMDTIDLQGKTFPLQITRDMRYYWRSSLHWYKFYALCPMNKLKKVYINYDIEVYGNHYVTHTLYRRKLVFDCRPKLW